jgi:hypothetical protein
LARESQIKPLSSFTSVSVDRVRVPGVFASHVEYQLRFVAPDGAVFLPPTIPREYHADAIRLAHAASKVGGLKYDAV